MIETGKELPILTSKGVKSSKSWYSIKAEGGVSESVVV
jgi:hypothetical protein